MPKFIVNLDDIRYDDWGRGENFAARIGRISGRLGAEKLGYNVTVLAPGKRAFPAHNHRANEEMFFILEGAGEIRVGAESFPVRQGDVIACPTGGPETAHQIVNTSQGELRYLAVSTMTSPELVVYPDSGKIAGYHWLAPAADGTPQRIRIIKKGQSHPDEYWEGEE
jgi:uncharacterized cupin superfamily protein